MKPIGIIGTGNFGLAVAYLASFNREVIIYGRRKEIVKEINTLHQTKGYKLPKNITATHDLSEIANKCDLIFPIIPSNNFRKIIKQISPFLKPHHILIHGTKGLDTPEDDTVAITKDVVKRMTEVILEETVVLRVGCLSGPNLSGEILNGQPSASVIASEYDEVVTLGQSALASEHFFVFDSYDIIGTEISGIYKNIIAIGTGILKGFGYGKNIEALLITRGLREMISFGQTLGSTGKAFLGTAGIGDLIATATSENSRNHQFGIRIGKGEKLVDIESSLEEVAEGVRTLKIVDTISRNEKMFLPITRMLYDMCYNELPVDKAISKLMRISYTRDVDFTI